MASKSITAGKATKGTLLSVFRTGGEWMAVVVALTSKAREPVLSKFVPVSELRGSAKRKADRWMAWLA